MIEKIIPKSVGGRIRLHTVIMVGIPLAFAVMVLILFVKTAILSARENELKEQVVSHKVFIEEWFKERQSSVRFLAQLDAVRQGRLDEVRTIFQGFNENHPDISAVVMIGPDGRTRVDTSSDIIVDVRDREYFIKGRQGEPHVTKVIIGRTSGKAIIIFSHPITLPDGTFGGVVFLPAQLTAINELMTNLHFGESGETYILNREGFMLTESRYLKELKAKGRVKQSAIMEIKVPTDIFTAAMEGRQPGEQYTDYRGVQVLGASTWTKNGSWLIVSEIDYAEAIGPFYPFLWTLVGGFLITLLLLTPVMIRLIRSIELPLARLSDQSRRMTRGDFDQTCVSVNYFDPPREIEHLYDAFCTMQEKVDSTVQQLEASAVTDQLTGLPNRRYLTKEGPRLVDIAIRAGQPCTLFMVDVDHFKRINDTYGHTVGDMVLKQLAAIFVDTLRSSDIAARFGGEEFIVVAPGSNLESGHELAERLRHAVAAATFNTEQSPLTCTISIGIAHYAKNINFGLDAYEDMISRADKALYEAKEAGRNTVRVNNGD